MVKLNKNIHCQCIPGSDISAEGYSAALQIIATWILRDIKENAAKTTSNDLTTKHPIYTIKSKKD